MQIKVITHNVTRGFQTIKSYFNVLKVFMKPNKVRKHWHSKAPARYKRNAINFDLHRAKRISSNFKEETKVIKEKYQRAGFPMKFVCSFIYK